MGIAPRSLYYWQVRSLAPPTEATPKAPPANKLKPEERNEIVNALLRPTWADISPREIYYRLLDEEKTLIASVSSFYRVARNKNLLTKRAKTSTGKKLNRETPHLVATGPNQVWSWDVTQIETSSRLHRLYLYVIIDIWSRFVVGWTLEEHEKSDHAIAMWKQALEAQAITGKGLTNHKDNGGIMRSDEMIKFVHDAKMIDSYSRAGVSDDNPFSESLFRTIQYFRDFPGLFADVHQGRLYFETYFKEYNFTHKHSGIQFLEPATRHYGEEPKVLDQRNAVVQDFCAKNRHRYSNKPKHFKPIIEVNIN
jgi:transposase InsO family protein